jgi:hypothetical protein
MIFKILNAYFCLDLCSYYVLIMINFFKKHDVIKILQVSHFYSSLKNIFDWYFQINIIFLLIVKALT